MKNRFHFIGATAATLKWCKTHLDDTFITRHDIGSGGQSLLTPNGYFYILMSQYFCQINKIHNHHHNDVQSKYFVDLK
ncbi:hypothetical protein DERP_010505 [Dermatophagoides pteronyssinus]|uniref:Uncharacterized protein n=1 Tax=Dermatophagoides pteronyssinus TaxID=6956 RepID=A0ABQ8JG11_DERPT|nr:hypothetical protein DERP_010505 [Dermatophagoides pteronyssinus]